MALFAVLAWGGVPGRADQRPAEKFSEDRLRAQLRADTQLEIIADPGELPPISTPSRPTSPAVNAETGTTPPNPAAAGRRGSPARRHDPPKPYRRDFRKVALREAKLAGIRRPELFVRQIAAESGFQPCARSGAGAMGIAQIMPGTARSWHVDPYNPNHALRVAARKMARYERHYGSYSVALAAYNAGPGAVEQYGGVPPYPETREYVRKITDTSYPLLGMQQVYRLPGGLNARFARRLQRMRRDARSRGSRITVNDGWRSYDEQFRLWKQAKRKYGFDGASKWVAPPGCSNHQRGYAADLGGDLALAHQLAPKYGLVFPMAHEPWHVELADIRTQSG